MHIYIYSHVVALHIHLTNIDLANTYYVTLKY